jgi:hypothetical protein
MHLTHATVNERDGAPGLARVGDGARPPHFWGVGARGAAAIQRRHGFAINRALDGWVREAAFGRGQL